MLNQGAPWLNRGGVKTVYFRSSKLRDILCHPKDPRPKDNAPCVYSTPAVVANNTLVKPESWQLPGQTRRPLKVRIAGHKKATEQGKVGSSALAEHANNNGHLPQWGEAKKLVQGHHLGLRLTRETVKIRSNENSTINRIDGKDLSHMWGGILRTTTIDQSEQRSVSESE